ncbi:hypothetical protein D3C78_1958450 [compost metagenome]
MLDGLHVLRGLQQAVMGAGIEPGEAAAKAFDAQVAACEVGIVDVGNFQLSTG